MPLALPKISRAQASHYRGIRSKITTIKKNWPGNEKIIRSIVDTYEGMIVNISQKVAEINHIDNSISEVIETAKSFFMQLLWEYDLNSAVNFTTFIGEHLFYRVKNYYEKQNGTTAYLVLGRSGSDNWWTEKMNSLDEQQPEGDDHRIRYTKGTISYYSLFECQTLAEDMRADQGMRRSMASDIWHTMIKNFDENDIDLIICSDLLKMKQREIGELFGIQQPDISDARREILSRMRHFAGGAEN